MSERGQRGGKRDKLEHEKKNTFRRTPKKGTKLKKKKKK